MLRYTPRRRPLAIRRCRPGEVHTVEEGLDAGAGAKDSHGPPRVCATKALIHRDLKFQLTRTKARLRIGSDGPFLNQQTQPPSLS